VANIANVVTKMFGSAETKQKIIGVRPGEKMDEVLVSKNESPRTKIMSDKFYVILPQFADDKLERHYEKFQPIESDEFNSRNARQLSDEEFVEVLKKEPWIKL